MNKESLAETMDDYTVSWLRNISAKKGAIITGSIIAKDEETTGTRFYNRMIWMLPNGKFAYYDKRHLFAYGTEDQHFSAGISG
ncbi:MAG: nitrilase-related carbon-nitrogen hydrolase [Puia sp.]